MSEKKLIGMCGIVCSECGAYLATRNSDEALRRKTSEEWSKLFGVKVDPKDIVCVGCMAPKGKHFHHCSECEIRLCGVKKKVKSCGQCNLYVCGKLEGFFKMAPGAKAVLDEERKKK